MVDLFELDGRYDDWLERQPLAERSRGEYAKLVAGFAAWLQRQDPMWRAPGTPAHYLGSTGYVDPAERLRERWAEWGAAARPPRPPNLTLDT